MFIAIAARLHPSTWWALAISLAVIAGAATNIVQTVSVAVISVLLILLFRENAPWARSLKFYLLLATAVVVIRIMFRIVFSFSQATDDVLLRLPSFELNFGLRFERQESASLHTRHLLRSGGSQLCCRPNPRRN
jgi:energy-coupling factor transporter transmembrane protein EcfT